MATLATCAATVVKDDNQFGFTGRAIDTIKWNNAASFPIAVVTSSCILRLETMGMITNTISYNVSVIKYYIPVILYLETDTEN